MVKKLICIILIAALSLSTLACGSKKEETPPEPTVNEILGESGDGSVGLSYKLNLDGTGFTVTGLGRCTDADVTIPSTYSGKPITAIDQTAFSGYTHIKSITLSSDIKEIEAMSFSGCSSLEKVVLPDGIEYVSYRAFDGCNKLQYNEQKDGLYLGNEANPYLVFVRPRSIAITSFELSLDTKVVAGGAFKDCADLISLTLPSELRSLGEYTFADCEKLKSVNIPESITEIRAGTFSGCRALDSIMLPGALTYIGDNAFTFCSSITSLILPKNVTHIGYAAFAGCSSITEIDLPDVMTELGVSAFADCTSLATVHLPAGLHVLQSGIFRNCKELTNVYFPGTEAIRNAINKAEGWALKSGGFDLHCTDGKIRVNDVYGEE